MMPGTKLNLGYNKKGIPGTTVGPLVDPETIDKCLTTFRQRAADACALTTLFLIVKLKRHPNP